MSLFGDLFGSGYQDAAKAEQAGLMTAANAEAPFYNQAVGTTQQYGAAALAPYTALNLTAGAGTDQLSKALGLSGNPADVLKTLQATPGYQFQLRQGEQAVDRGAAARGMVTSGNTLNAEDQFAQGLAGTTYNNYVSQLQPYLGVAENAAAGTAGVNQNTGGNLANLQSNQGNLVYNTNAGIGNAQAAADTASQNAENSFINGVVNLGGKIMGYASGKGATAS